MRVYTDIMLVVGLDIGGTKVHGALVAADGAVLREQKSPVHLHEGPGPFAQQLAKMIVTLAEGQNIRAVGLGCAGPLDSETGELLDPTNFFTDGKSWGKVPLIAMVKKELEQLKFSAVPLHLENDAAAAVLGEAWLGGGEQKNILVMTLGTGVGVGVLVNGRLTRSRHNLHPEASHIPLNYSDTSALCGCGNQGCIEAYLSGVNFTQRLAREWNEPNLTGEELGARAKGKEEKVLAAFARYSEWLAQAIHAYAVLYAPKSVVLSGGFSTLSENFLPQTQKLLPDLLKRRRDGVDLLPTVKVSRLYESIGVLGAARVALIR